MAKTEAQIVKEIMKKAEMKGSGHCCGKRFAVPTGRRRMIGEGRHEDEMVYMTKGGGWKSFWKGVKKTSKKAWKATKPLLKKGHKFAKKHKLVSKALKELAPFAGPAAPKVALAAKGAKALGYGAHRHSGYGLSPAGGGLKRAGGGLKSAGGGKHANPWIRHVKAYCKKHNCPYAQGLKRAKATYKK